MQKLVFAFRRKLGMSRRSFHEHYVDVHAPLGLRANRMISRYTVNLVTSGEADLDAVTEVWTPSAARFLSPEAFVSTALAQELIADHSSFMAPQDAFLVEESVVVGSGSTARRGGDGGWVKVVDFLAADHRSDEHPAEAVRVVDNSVTEIVYAADQTPEEARMGSSTVPDVATIRMLWLPRHSVRTGHDPGRTARFIVDERRLLA